MSGRLLLVAGGAVFTVIGFRKGRRRSSRHRRAHSEENAAEDHEDDAAHTQTIEALNGALNQGATDFPSAAVDDFSNSYPINAVQRKRSCPLLLHALLSLALLYLSTLFAAPSWLNLSFEAWRQLTGALLLGPLIVHTAAYCFCSGGAGTSREVEAAAAAAAVHAAAAPAVSRPETVAALNGVWIKDKRASDSMDPVCDLMRLNSLLRVAIGLIRGVHIEAAPGGVFKIDVLSAVLWFKIREKYDLSSAVEVRHRRRDFRGGGSFAVAREAREGGVEVSHRFGAPLAGTMLERFHCPSPDELHLQTLVEVPERGAPLSYRQIYRRKGAPAVHREYSG